ncbi:MAG: DUF2007 domain-containing protein [Deltaproteobacteria bacterium]|nr:DUF2007 domain-containing protein [Deltaproteobacteria bacterium]
MICPVCKAEYRDGFTQCADCGVDLVHELQAPDQIEQHSPDKPFVELTRTNDPALLAFLQSVLTAEEIRFAVLGAHSMSIPVLGGSTHARVLVAEADFDKATALLTEIEKNESNTGDLS